MFQTYTNLPACPRLQNLYKRYTMLQRISFHTVYICQFSLPPVCRKVKNIKDSLAHIPSILTVDFSSPPHPTPDRYTQLQGHKPCAQNYGVCFWFQRERERGGERMALSHQHSSPVSLDPFFPLHVTSIKF
jgi:hypothetical protein